MAGEFNETVCERCGSIVRDLAQHEADHKAIDEYNAAQEKSLAQSKKEGIF